MTREEAIKYLTAKLECMKRSKGFREKCDTYNSYEGCYECDLAYKQGNIGEQIESLKLVIKALEEQSTLDKIRAEIQGLRNCSCSCSDGIIDDVEDIIDKYKEESEK